MSSLGLVELAASTAGGQLARAHEFSGIVDAGAPRRAKIVRRIPMRLPSLMLTCALLASCSSDDHPPDFVDPDVPGRDANPEGVPYPTDSLGGSERASTHPGQRIPNFTFQAYVNGDRGKGLQTVSLADFYDPEQKHHKVLDIQISQVWCTICSVETDSTSQLIAELTADGAVFLQIMTSGSDASRGPALEEVDAWVDRHEMTYTLAIDVRARRMSGLGVNTVPWDILVDTRTMEILDSSAGAPSDVAKYVRDGLQWVATHPPSYSP
jgi:hypothetical protein